MNNGEEIKEMYVQIPKKQVDSDTIISISYDLESLDNISDDIRKLKEAFEELDDDHATRVVADLISKLLSNQVKLANQISVQIEATFYNVTKLEIERAE